jgi:alanyl-tRNA synthetase
MLIYEAMTWTAQQLRKKFLEFFREKDHAVIPPASLIPEHDPTVLFTTAGMHPLVPYLSGQKHPLGTRLADVQPCIRTGDIDEVGDNRHLTFFEMLGNWSLGDYFKKEAIKWSFEFLTGEPWLHLDPKHIYVTVFEGDENAPLDEESISIWREVFGRVGMIAEVGERIFTYGKEKNWWGPAGQTGPCGPDTEMFYDTGRAHRKEFGTACHPNCDCGRFVEVWNDVFMQYQKTADGKFEPLAQKNVDTGMGLERMLTVLQGTSDVFETTLFQSIFRAIDAQLPKKEHSSRDDRQVFARRVIADHLRAAVFIIGDRSGVAPSNVDQGYVVRRLIRRAIRNGFLLGIETNFLAPVAQAVITDFSDAYPYLSENESRVLDLLSTEEDKFRKTLKNGIRELEKILSKPENFAGRVLLPALTFKLYDTFGFPFELTREIVEEKGYTVDSDAFHQQFMQHQEKSRHGAQQRFAGGLADHSEMSRRYHSATHLTHAALRRILGTHVFQKGSNITQERMRFDFSHPKKLTPQEVKAVEDLVNEQIARGLEVTWEEVPTAEAKKLQVLGLFDEKYGDRVKVYTMGDFSQEICGGPHVKNTREIGHFKIVKEEAVSAGVRRIKAVVEPPSGGEPSVAKP